MFSSLYDVGAIGLVLSEPRGIPYIERSNKLTAQRVSPSAEISISPKEYFPTASNASVSNISLLGAIKLKLWISDPPQQISSCN